MENIQPFMKKKTLRCWQSSFETFKSILITHVKFFDFVENPIVLHMLTLLYNVDKGLEFV